MSLAAPVWLALLALAPLILLLHGRRRQPREVSSTKLWEVVAQGAEPRPRPRRPPSTVSLWLQLLALAALALALAEPRRTGLDPATDRYLVVLDAGAAMSVRDDESGLSRYERAVTSLAASVREGRGAYWTIWWAGPDARPIVVDGRDPAAIVRALRATRPADAAVDWGALADAVLPGVESGTPLIVYTAAGPAAEEGLADRVSERGGNLEVRSFSAPFDNLAVESVAIERDEASPRRWLVNAVVRAHGSVPARGAAPDLVVSFRPDGAETAIEFARRSLAFSRAGAAEVSLDLDLPGAGLIEIALAEHDLYVADDVFRARLEPSPPSLSVAVLTRRPDDNATIEALSSIDGLSVRPTQVLPPASEVDLLVIDGVADPWALDADAGARPPSILWLGSAPGVADPEDLPLVDPAVTAWRQDLLLTRSTAWSSFEASRARSLPPRPGTIPVVSGLAGPLVEARVGSQSRDLLVAFDPTDRAWTTSSAFITFMADAVRWLAPPTPPVASCTAGLPCAVPPEAVAGGAVMTLDGEDSWRWPAPSSALPTAIDEAWTPLRAGLWRWETADRSGEIAVNASPGGMATIATAAVAEAGDATADRARVAVSGGLGARWLVALAAVIVLVEGLLGGLRTERFWQPRAWRGGGPASARRRRAVLLHVATVLALGLAVAAVPWPRLVDDRYLVLISSTGREAVSAPQGIREWPRERLIEQRLDVLSGEATNLEAALRQGLAAVGHDGRARVVLSSEAGPTRGNLLPLLGELVDAGVVVDLLPASRSADYDVVVERVFPDRVPRAGETITLHGAITAGSESSGILRVYRDERLEVEIEVELEAGTSLLNVPVLLDEPGTVRLTVEIDVSSDEVFQNNVASVLLAVASPPTVYVVARDEPMAADFAGALQLQGLEALSRLPQSLPASPSGYLGVDAVVLLDVPAIALTSTQQQALETYVRDMGGGLVITGGENSFGPGGYYETALDRLSPLSAQIPRDAPEVAMLFILDRSGSMQQTVAGTTRLEVAKHATMTAVELLGERSQAAIIVFDEEAQTLLPFTSTADPEAMRVALGPLSPGGGTSIYPALLLAVEVLQQTDAATKHVVLMTDGLSQPGDFVGAIERITELEATVSAVAIGLGSDADRVKEIARLGGGTAHVTTDFSALPSILAQEALMVSGDPLVRERTSPRRGPDLNGLLSELPDSLPEIAAFVETSAKQDADISLEDSEGRPLLASWRYGSGRVVAFASHAIGEWTADWSDLTAYPTWWGQWVRWTAQGVASPGLDPHLYVIGDELLVEVSAIDPEGSPAGRLGLRAFLSQFEGASSASRTLREVAPGRYVGRLPIQPGDAVVTIEPASTQPWLVPVTVPVTHTYPAAWAGAGDLSELEAWVRATGGATLTASDPWEFAGSRRLDLVPAWRPWLVIAALLWAWFLMVRYAPGRLMSFGFRPLLRVNRVQPL